MDQTSQGFRTHQSACFVVVKVNIALEVSTESSFRFIHETLGNPVSKSDVALASTPVPGDLFILVTLQQMEDSFTILAAGTGGEIVLVGVTPRFVVDSSVSSFAAATIQAASGTSFHDGVYWTRAHNCPHKCCLFRVWILNKLITLFN